MAILDDLANELLIDIVSRLRCDNQALFSLAVVSRRFCTITSQLIFRHITLENDPAPDPPSPEYDGAGVRKKTKALLLRSLCENDALSKEVRSCGPIEILPVPPLLQHGVDPMGFDLLSRCSNLEEVHIYCSIATTQDPPPHGMNDIFALLPRLQHLEAISLAGYPRSQTIAACLLVPSLRSLSVNNVSIMSLDDNDSENLLLQNSEHKFLRKLSISGDKWQRGPRGVCKTSTLNQLLLSCPGLEELHLDLPLGFSFWGYPPPEYTFSAIGIADSLRSLRDTLTVLQLTIPWRGLVESSDVPVDLSDLVRVKDLKISASCLLPMEPGPDGRDKLYQALPTNLEALHVGILEVIVPFNILTCDVGAILACGRPIGGIFYQVGDYRRR